MFRFAKNRVFNEAAVACGYFRSCLFETLVFGPRALLAGFFATPESSFVFSLPAQLVSTTKKLDFRPTTAALTELVSRRCLMCQYCLCRFHRVASGYSSHCTVPSADAPALLRSLTGQHSLVAVVSRSLPSLLEEQSDAKRVSASLSLRRHVLCALTRIARLSVCRISSLC
jgi:hypothetical protein